MPTFVVVVGGTGSSGADDGVGRALAAAAAEAVGGVGDAREVVVVAADSGLHLARALGLRVDHLVGDLDSADPALVIATEATGTVVHRHAADKDATDSELAIDLVLDLTGERGRARGEETRSAGADPLGIGPADATASEPDRLVVLGGGGGRLDHLLADLLHLAAPRLAPMDVTAHLGAATVQVVRVGRPRTLFGAPGEQVSLIPVGARTRGVTTSGLRWTLIDADLVPGTTRGVSNELVGTSATVSVAEGVLLAVRPGTFAAPIAPRTSGYDPTPRDLDDRR